MAAGNTAASAPYRLRAKAVETELTGGELWCVLLHLAKHRGFRSNRLTRPDDRAKPKAGKKSGDNDDEDAGYWKQAEDSLRRRMADHGAKTVGCLLAADLDAGKAVRMRYNRRGDGEVCAPTRALIAAELDTIIARQSAGFASLDWPRVRSLVLEQRPLRSKGGGPCEFFPEEVRALRDLPSAQEFLARQTLSNLRVRGRKDDDARPLTAEEYDTALGLLSKHRSLEWSKLRAAIGLKGVKFTIELGGGGKRASQRVEGNQTDATLGPLVPGWNDSGLSAKDALFETLWGERRDRTKLLALITDGAGPLAITQPDTAAAIADAIQFDLPTGLLGISKKAARLIAWRLGPGVPVHEAIKAATGKDHSDRRPDERLARLPYYAQVMRDVGLDGSHDPAHMADPERYYGRIPNISVHIALNEIAKLVNALIDRYGGGPRLVVIETTRELKAGTDERKRIQRDQAERERQNAAIDVELRKTDRWLANAHERRLRWRLGKRQNWRCPYSGERLAAADLLTEAYEVDHVIPRALGGRDTVANMVLCLASANRDKGDRTPWQAFHSRGDWVSIRDQFLAGLDPDTRNELEWRFSEKADQRAAKWGGSEKADDNGFWPRQFTDAGYIARTALRYLLHIVPDQPRNGVVASRGSLTGWLRGAWRISPEGRGRDLVPLSRDDLVDDDAARAAVARIEPAYLRKAVQAVIESRHRDLVKSVPDAGFADAAGSILYEAASRKNRFDHRHHFLDAAVIAVTSRGLLQRIGTLHGRLGGDALPDPRQIDLEEPFPGFRAAVLRAHAHLWPSHRPRHGDGGALHAETLYGVREIERNGGPVTVLTTRKSVDALFKDAYGKPLADDKVLEKLEKFVSSRMRDRFEKAVSAERSRTPEKGLAELCLAAAAS
ncbi:MAG: CRISPR-associated protein Csn1, partial [Alphaproteobacteria bacterium]|nr:CRISPR-associated protein Csn1 [Alphaproteobacteria bacterium]